MLTLKVDPTFEAKVSIATRNGPAEIACVFRWMHVRDLVKFLRAASNAAKHRSLPAKAVQAVLRLLARIPGVKAWAADRIVVPRSDFDYLNEILVSWSGVDLPWGQAAFDRLVEQYPEAPALIVEAWVKALGENRLGN